MLYKSAYSALQVLVRSKVDVPHPATGVVISTIPELTADFGSHGGEFTSTDPLTGALVEHAIIHGHFFDSEAAQEQLGWSDDERESVEATLDQLAVRQPFLLAKIEMLIPKAEPPWPTYDGLVAKEAVTYAVNLGLVHETLRYEMENENRDSVTKPLQKWIDNNEANIPPVQSEGNDEAVFEIQKTGITL